MVTISWQWSSFSELDLNTLYAFLALRNEVFIGEQNCLYQDLDAKDQVSFHLIGKQGDEVVAYLRVIEPGKKYLEPAIGRVLVRKQNRGQGLAKKLMQIALEKIELEYPKQGVRLSAQQYLEKFYRDLGFKTVSEVYLEDKIPHVEMLLSSPDRALDNSIS